MGSINILLMLCKLEGETIGIEKNKIDIAKEMLSDGEPMEKIMRFTKWFCRIYK